MATKTDDSGKLITFAPRWKTMTVTIKGLSPLAMQNRPQSVIENLRRKDNGLPTINYKSSDWRRFIDSIHWIDESKKPNTLDDSITEEQYKEQFDKLLQESEKTGKPLFYIPTEAFKESICSGAYRNGITKDKVSLRGYFIVRGDKAPISFSSVEMESVPTINRNARGAMVISVYSKFNDWETQLKISYNEELISAENLINIICASGLSTGVMARRTELSFGKYGTFTASKVEQ